MLKSILNVQGVHSLTKEQKKIINGGLGADTCVTIKITNEIYGPYNGDVYAPSTIYFRCNGGAVQTGPWHSIAVQ